MKKFALIITLLTFSGAAAFASSNFHTPNANASEMVYIYHDHIDFKRIELTELPDAVKNAVENDNKEVVIQSAEEGILENGDKVYRVTFQTADASSKTKSFTADGEKYEM